MRYLLFHRIRDTTSISVAQDNGYLCLPIVIAESWGGDLGSLNCEYIYIQANPNQVSAIEPLLRQKLRKVIHMFRDLK